MADSEANDRSPEDAPATAKAGEVLPDGSVVSEILDLSETSWGALRDMDPEVRADATARIVKQVRESGGSVDLCSRDECGG